MKYLKKDPKIIAYFCGYPVCLDAIEEYQANGVQLIEVTMTKFYKAPFELTFLPEEVLLRAVILNQPDVIREHLDANKETLPIVPILLAMARYSDYVGPFAVQPVLLYFVRVMSQIFLTGMEKLTTGLRGMPMNIGFFQNNKMFLTGICDEETRQAITTRVEHFLEEIR